jgi:hypothetical protein
VGNTGGASVNNTTGWVLTQSPISTAPLGAAYMAVRITANSVGASEIHYVDDVTVTLVPETVAATLDESVYSDFDLSFSSEDCINSVTVKRLGPDPADSTKTIETVYGPYEDTASVEEWGRHSAEFTVHGISEADVAAYAASILARNATPELRVNSVTLAVTETSHITERALLDLGDLVNIVNTDKGIDQTLRVNRITHRITPEKWMIDLGFAGANSVASPQVTPPVQDNGATSEPHMIAVLTANQAITTSFGALTGYTTLSNSSVSVSGTTFTVPAAGRYELTATVYFDGLIAGHRAARFVINGTAMQYFAAAGAGAGAYTAVTLVQPVVLTANSTVTLETSASANMNAMGGTSGHGFTRVGITWVGA